ncbi:MAG TPA: HlyD family efflux transporter periplasmic adaptor subunit, partial [Planctomycetota bacterium]|nr:HlyD family efflux transporter periplasmic adaptor subunit [Planctomycetota bacterium]
LAGIAYTLWSPDFASAFGARSTYGTEVGGRSEKSAGPNVSVVGELFVHTVQLADLPCTVRDSGTLESAGSVNVLSEVEGEVAIIKLVPEGTRVEAGAVVVELESSTRKTACREQQIKVVTAEAALSQAVNAYQAAVSLAQSEVATAEKDLEFAELDQGNYENGEYPLQLRSLQSDTALAQQELARAQTQLTFSEELYKDRYINLSEVEADRFKVRQMEVKVKIAEEKERLLKDYTYPRTKRDFEAKVTEAKRALERRKSLAKGAVEQAGADKKAKESTLALEKAKLAHFEEQILKCSMKAPQAGPVVYPTPEDADLVELFIKQGTIIRERQHVFSIPDTDVLQVSMSIHEAQVNQIKPGMKARIWIDGDRERELSGAVLTVSPLPEPGDWRRTTVKFYETKVRIDGATEGLRPGMSAKVEILFDHLQNVLAVPVQSVVRRGRIGVCYVLNGRPELRRLQLGKSNLEYVAVLEGLSAGENVVLSPDMLGFPADALEQAFESGVQPAVLNGDGSVVPAPADAPQETKTETAFEGVLAGPAGITVEAEYKIKTKGTTTNFKFQIKVEGGPPGAVWDVVVDGVRVGNVTLDAAGMCEVEWNTKDGNFPAAFPTGVGEGSKVKVGADFSGSLAAVAPQTPQK